MRPQLNAMEYTEVEIYYKSIFPASMRPQLNAVEYIKRCGYIMRLVENASMRPQLNAVEYYTFEPAN